MSYVLTDIEKEIVALREEQKLSFRLIGEQCGMTTSKATHLYHKASRMLRANRCHELRQKQNLITVSFELSIGETVILQRILQLFQSWKMSNCRGNSAEWHALQSDPDYLSAIDLQRRLSDLEHRERRKATPDAAK